MSALSHNTRRDIENWIEDIDEDDPPDPNDPQTWSNFPCLMSDDHFEFPGKEDNYECRKG